MHINWNDGQPIVVPAIQLRNKLEHRYVRDTLALNEKTVLMSPFDLNIEHNAIEQPTKPTIRLNVPVFDSDGLKRGMVVLNYRGQRLLDRLRAIAEQNYGKLWLLNADGYWLMGSHSEMEWGFMYPERQTLRFDREYGEDIWSSMLRGPQHDQWMHEKGLFTYARIGPTKLRDNAEGEPWILVTQVPSAAIAASTARHARNLIIASMVLAPLLILLSGVITYHTGRRRQAEETQRQVKSRYQKLVNNLPVGVCRNTPDEKGRFLEVNPAMVDIFEAESIDQLLAHPFSELYCDPVDRKIFIDKVMRQGRVNGEEVRLKTLRGREFDAALTAVMKKDTTGEIYFDGIIEDISVRKEGERKIQQLNNSLRTRSKELEVINQELEAFSYSVSHDLRAPLRAIDGFSRTLLNEYSDRLDDKGRDRLRRVRTAAQRMADLIDDLLKLSRVTRTEIKWEPVDLTQLAKEVIEALRQDEPKRVVQFSVHSGMTAYGDARLLRVVMDNLLSNAWKFTNQRSEAIIEVGCNFDKKALTYFVRDNGAGFDMAYVSKLFGAFQRLHDAGEFPGSGIGLATVQRVIHKHSGCIWAKSAVDQGAIFYFTLNEKRSV